jgi:hypothetical protein
MQPKAKIRLDSIETLQKTLEALPEHRQEEVTKVQAIRMLAPQIHAMQSKGYNLASIAAVLSERGIAVSAGALKSYLSHSRGGEDRKTRGRKSRPAAASVARPAPARAGDPEASAASSVASTVSSSASPIGPREGAQPHPAPKPAGGFAERRSAFVPRKDSDDI